MKNRGLPVLVILGLVILLVFTAIGLKFMNEEAEEENRAQNVQGISIALDEKSMEKQRDLERTYLEQLEKGNYTEENMLVIGNPYGISPLTALVLFKTDEPAKVTVEVPGNTDDAAITYSLDDYKTTHKVPVLGLLSETANEVSITVEKANGEVTENVVTITTGKLPEYIGTVDVKIAETEKMELGGSALTFFVPSTKYAYAFDTNGDVRWYCTRYNSHVFQELENGHILFLTKEKNSGQTYNILVEMDYLGKYHRIYELSSEYHAAEAKGNESTIIHHDAIELPNGNFLLTVNADEKYIEDVMIEIERDTGRIVKTIDLKELFPAPFYEKYRATKREDGKIDWFHQNSVVYDKTDNSIIISGRHQDTVMKINYDTNEIVWILAAHEGWPSRYKEVLLRPEGKDFKFPAAQHTAVIMPDQDGNEDTIDILVYDNNVVISRGDKNQSEKFSRAVQYRINEKQKTVKEIWSFGEQFGEAYFTRIVGSVRYLPETGNPLINFGYMDQDTRSGIFEVGEDGGVVMEAYVTDFPAGSRAYRAERFSLYNGKWEVRLEES